MVFLYILLFCLGWYLSGFLCVMIALYYDKSSDKIGEILKYSFLGLFILLGMIFYLVSEVLPNLEKVKDFLNKEIGFDNKEL